MKGWIPSQDTLHLYDCIIWLQNQNIQPLELLGTGSPLYGDTTVVSECHPHGTATVMKYHLEEEANVCSMLIWPRLHRYLLQRKHCHWNTNLLLEDNGQLKNKVNLSLCKQEEILLLLNFNLIFSSVRFNWQIIFI